MKKSWVPSKIDVDERALKSTVQTILKNEYRASARVASLERKPCEFATLFPADILSVNLEGGDKIRLFLKHVGYEESSHPDKLGPQRETQIYLKLFQGTSLPVPKVYGCHPNRLSHRHEMFLEYLDGWTLQYHDLEHWFSAATRLADLHLHFECEELDSRDFLNSFNQEYFTFWAHRAVTVVSCRAPKLANRLERIVVDYDKIAKLLSNQPSTLVHNDLAPKNVIADTSVDPARIYFIDWEMAGVGCGLLDLVHLKYGLDEENDQRMLRTYLRALEGSMLLPSTAQELDQVLFACELHKSIYRLGHIDEWGVPDERVAEFIGESERFFLRI